MRKYAIRITSATVRPHVGLAMDSRLGQDDVVLFFEFASVTMLVRPFVRSALCGASIAMLVRWEQRCRRHA